MNSVGVLLFTFPVWTWHIVIYSLKMENRFQTVISSTNVLLFIMAETVQSIKYDRISKQNVTHSINNAGVYELVHMTPAKQ